MRKIIYAILISIFFIGCASTNTIQKPISEENAPKINEDNLRLETVMKTYAGYDELVKRGFDIHSLDYIKNVDEFCDALEPYFYNYEDGSAFDLHFGGVTNNVIKDRLCSRTFFSKEELLSKGFIDNQTFFESSNIITQSYAYFSVNSTTKSYGFIEENNLIFIKISKHPEIANSYSDFFKKAKKKDIIIIDLSSDHGGYLFDAINFIKGMKSLENKKIYVLIDYSTGSCGEFLAAHLKKDIPNVKLIGQATRGTTRYSLDPHSYDFPSLGIYNFCISCPHYGINDTPEYKAFIDDVEPMLKEGIGLFPDYWIAKLSEEQIIKFINNDVGYELLPIPEWNLHGFFEKGILYNWAKLLNK